MALYETQQEAQLRLGGTYFLYKNQPVQCLEVTTDRNDSINLSLIFYPRGIETANVKLGDPDLQYRGLQLGYCNTPEGATYLRRQPTRRYKQGLTNENCVGTALAATGAPPRFDNLARSIAFKDMLTGSYPTFDQAVERLEATEGPPSVAFNRCFAIAKDPFRGDHLLYYKGERVGFGKLEYQVPEDFHYLREVIQQSGIRVR